MGKRRDGREAAVQFLFQRDLHAGKSDPLELFWSLRGEPDQKTRSFAQNLIEGVIAHQTEIDERIKKHSTNFELNRIAAVDRNIIRVAVFEMLHSPETPPVVAINEAIEIAKKFGAEESRKFVNGMLDNIRKELPRPAREPVQKPFSGPQKNESRTSSGPAGEGEA